MTSSKAREKFPEELAALAAPAEAARELRRRRRGGLWTLGGALAALGLAAAAAWCLLPDDARAIAECQRELSAALDSDDDARLAAARAVEQRLTGRLRGWGDASEANLLLAAAVAAQADLDKHYAANAHNKIEAALDRVRPGACHPERLRLAATLLARHGLLPQADWLCGQALRQDTPEARAGEVELLRLALAIGHALGNENVVLGQAARLSTLAPADPYPVWIATRVYEQRNHPEPLVDAYEKLLTMFSPDGVLELRSPLPETLDEAPGGRLRVEWARLRLLPRLIEIGDRAKARAELDWLQQRAGDALRGAPALEPRLLLLEGRAAEALARADALLAENQQRADVALVKGQILLAQARPDEAAALLRRLVETDPYSSEGHFLLGQAYARLGQRELAQQHLATQRRLLDTRVRLHQLQRAAAGDPRNVATRLEIAVLYLSLGEQESAAYWREAAERAER